MPTFLFITWLSCNIVVSDQIWKWQTPLTFYDAFVARISLFIIQCIVFVLICDFIISLSDTLSLQLRNLASLCESSRTETGICDDLVSIIALLSMLGLHLSIPACTNSVLDCLCGLERLEGLEKWRQKQTIFHLQRKWKSKILKVFQLHEPPGFAIKNTALKLQSLSHIKSRCNLSKRSVPILWCTLVVTCTGIHPSLSLKYSPLRSFLNTSALTRCTRSISSSLFTTNIYTHPFVRAAESDTRATETRIRFGFIGARSYCRDFIKGAPVCVASKRSIVSDLGIAFTVTWWTWKSHFPLFPNWKKTCKIHNVHESKQQGAALQ